MEGKKIALPDQGRVQKPLMTFMTFSSQSIVTKEPVKTELIQGTHAGNLCYLLGQSPMPNGAAGKADKMTHWNQHGGK